MPILFFLSSRRHRHYGQALEPAYDLFKSIHHDLHRYDREYSAMGLPGLQLEGRFPENYGFACEMTLALFARRDRSEFGGSDEWDALSAPGRFNAGPARLP